MLNRTDSFKIKCVCVLLKGKGGFCSVTNVTVFSSRYTKKKGFSFFLLIPHRVKLTGPKPKGTGPFSRPYHECEFFPRGPERVPERSFQFCIFSGSSGQKSSGSVSWGSVLTRFLFGYGRLPVLEWGPKTDVSECITIVGGFLHPQL